MNFYGVSHDVQDKKPAKQTRSLARALILSKAGTTNPRKPRAGPGLSSRERSAKQQREKRARRYAMAAQLSSAAGYPLTHHLTLTWGALKEGERRDGHCLHLPEPEVVSRLWRNLKNLMRKHGLPFIAMRAPEYDNQRSCHLHVVIHLPKQLTPDLLRVVENLTGAPNDTTTIFTVIERQKGYIARSGCCGWLLQENRRVGAGGELGLAGYITKSTQRPEIGSRYYLSGDLSRLLAANGPSGASEGAENEAMAISQHKAT